jgi:hypothetical protein
MILVDMIGQIRRAYFEQQWPIKKIVRTLSFSPTRRSRIETRGARPRGSHMPYVD